MERPMPDPQFSRLIVGISGATGSLYGIRLLQALQGSDVETHLIVSRWGARTLIHETPYTLDEVQQRTPCLAITRLLSSENDFKAFLREMVVVGQDFRNPVATHRRHRYAVHRTIALVIALLIQTQACQKGFPRLRMNRHARIA